MFISSWGIEGGGLVTKLVFKTGIKKGEVKEIRGSENGKTDGKQRNTEVNISVHCEVWKEPGTKNNREKCIGQQTREDISNSCSPQDTPDRLEKRFS